MKILLPLGALACMAVIWVYTMAIGMGLMVLDALSVLPAMLAAIAALLTFITSIFKSPDALYRSRDLDMLLSLPIPARTVALARLLKLYAMNLLFTLGVLIPGCVSYALLAHPPAGFYVSYALTMLCVPMLPQVLGALLGALIVVVGSSFKGLRYVGLALMLVVLLGVVGGSWYMSFTGFDQTLLANAAQGLVGALGRLYPLTGLYSRAVNGALGALCLFIALSVLTMALAGALFGRSFGRVSAALNMNVRHNRFVMTAQRRSSAATALLRREWRRYLSINSYVLNTAFGLLLSLVAVVAVVVIMPREKLLAALEIENMDGILFALLPFVLSWLVGMAPTTASAVSVEGKTLWIVKSLPVSAYDWLLPKLRLNLQMALPVALVDALVLAVAYRVSGLALVVLVLMPMLTCVFMALMGLILNCMFPRFDWTNVTRVCKNGVPVMAAVFVSMILNFGGLFLSLAVEAMGYMLVPALFTVVLALICLGMWLLLRARAHSWAVRMEA